MDNNCTIKKEFAPGDIVLNRYKIIKKFTQGGMASTIYLADNLDVQQSDTFDSKDNRKVAIKVINRSEDSGDENWNRFCDECKTSIRIKKCKNVINTIQTSKSPDNQQIIIVMEYVNGKSLADIIREKGALGVEESLFIFKMILLALKDLYSFKQKIIHRDLKPDNILLSADQTTIKIIDFGISSVVMEDVNNERRILTDEKNQSGTYAYYSPHMKQVIGKNGTREFNQAINPQCDFFAIGIILYEMLTGSRPFYSDDYEKQDVINLPLRYDIPPLSKSNPKIPTALENVIFRCTASKPEDRQYNYTSIDQIISDVQNIIYKPDEAKIEKLIKPYEKRTLQNIEVFNIEKEDLKLKFYNKKWFFWIFIFSAGIISLTIIVLVIIDLFF